MSENDTVAVESVDGQLLTAEYKDGQLQIVEVAPFDKKGMEHIIPDVVSADDADGQGQKYMQVLDTDKGLVQLDLLNLTLVKCEDGEESYRLVANGDSDGGADLATDGTVTCVLQASDGDDEHDNQEYVMMEGDAESLVFLQQDTIQETSSSESKNEKSALSATELLERAKALQKAKALMSQSPPVTRVGKRGRKRKGELPPPHELLASPNFKLFLYSCKMCSFKCNAVKELTAHKALEHGSGSGGSGGKYRAGASSAHRGPANSLQCARCPFRGATHPQLMKHVHEKHFSDNKVSLDTKEVEAADVLVCGACGFESSSRLVFKRHIENVHGAVTS